MSFARRKEKKKLGFQIYDFPHTSSNLRKLIMSGVKPFENKNKIFLLR